jgi:hypothetical protein
MSLAPREPAIVAEATPAALGQYKWSIEKRQGRLKPTQSNDSCKLRAAQEMKYIVQDGRLPQLAAS